MDNQEYEQCIGCKTDLLEEPIDLDVGVVFDLLFCPNKLCSRYLLYTNVPYSVAEAPSSGEQE